MKNRQIKMPVKKLLALVFVLAIVISLIPFSMLLNNTASAINSDYATNGISIQGDNSAAIASISEGQVWAGKTVTSADSATGEFGIKLSALGGRIPGGMNGAALISGNLVLTDVVGSGFEFVTTAGGDKIAFQLDGALKEAVFSTDDMTYKHFMYSDAATGISVEFNVYKSNYEVIYTIPAAQLKLADAGSAGIAAYNTLSYGVILSDSAINSTYYTNTTGCKADFTAATTNSYYYTPASSSTGTKMTKSYQNTQEIGEWIAGQSTSTDNHNWIINYTNHALGTLSVASVVIDGVTYVNNDPSNPTYPIDPDYHLTYYTIEVRNETIVPGSSKTNTEYSFDFTPGTGNGLVDYNSLTCIYSYSNQGSFWKPNWILTPSSVTVGGITYTGSDVTASRSGKDTTGMGYWDITVKHNAKQIVTLNFSPLLDDFNSGNYTINPHHSASLEVTPFTWHIKTAAVAQFTVNTAPTGLNTPASVTVSKAGDSLDGTTITGTASAFSNASAWIFTGSKAFTPTLNPNGSTTTVTRNYTVSYASSATGANLTVNYTDTTAITGYWKNSANSNGAVTLPLTACGVISLKNNIGSLQITNSVSDGKPGQTFDFKVTLGASLTAPTATVSRWDTTLNALGAGNPVDLVNPISLGDKDQLLITNITNGTSYGIVKSDVPGYSTQVTGAVNGSISGGQTIAVTFSNVFDMAPLTVEKNVLDATPATHTDGSYDFTATFTLPAGVTYQNISYTIYDSSAGTSSAAVLVGDTLIPINFSLAAGDTISFINIPVNALYQVVETTRDNAIVSHSIDGTVSKGKTATGAISVVSNSVQFTNDYVTPAPLTISKVVTAVDNYGAVSIPSSFNYEIYFYNLIVDKDKVAAAEEELTTANGKLSDAENNLKTALSSYDSKYGLIDAVNVPSEAVSLLDSLIDDEFDPKGDIPGQVTAAIASIITEQDALDKSDAAIYASSYATLEALKTPLVNVQTAGVDAALAAYNSAKSIADSKQTAFTAAQAPSKEIAYNLPADQLTYGNINLNDGTDTTDGKYTFALQNSQSISFVYLPADVHYQVTEKSSGANYTTINVNSVKVNDTRNGDSLTTSGTVLWDGLPNSTGTPISVQYTNDYSITRGTLQVTKTVTGDPAWRAPAEGYSFTVEIYQGGIKANKTTADITLLAGGSAYFRDLLPGTTYTVTENTTGMTSSVINDPSNGKMQLSGYSVQTSAVTCVNTYDSPAIETSKTVNKSDVNVNELVTYAIAVDYNYAQNASSIVIFDQMFSETDAASMSVDYGNTSKKLDYTLDNDTLTLYLDNTNLHNTDNIVTVSYSVSFGSMGEYKNTARSNVIYKASPDATATYPYPADGSTSKETIVTVHDGSLYPGCLTLMNNVVDPLYWLHTGPWDFTVTFDQTGIKASNGAAPEADGKTFNVSLANGESVKFSGLLKDTTYNVTEMSTGMDKVTMNGNLNNTTSAMMVGGKDSIGNDVVLGQTVSCVNTYNAPAAAVDKTANDQKNLNIIVGSTVDYKISITYDHPGSVYTVDIDDPMFALMNAGSLKVLLNETELTETAYELTVNATTNTNTLTINPGSFGEETSGTITITYSVVFTSTGIYSNKADVTVTYAPSIKPVDTSNDEGSSMMIESDADSSTVSANASSTAIVNVYFPGTNPITPSPAPADDGKDVAGEQDKPGVTSPSPSPSDSSGQAVAGDTEKLPQTGGISPSTLLALLGLTLIAAGGSAFIIIRKKNHGKNN